MTNLEFLIKEVSYRGLSNPDCIFPDGRRCCKTCRAASFAKYKAKIEGGESHS